MKKFTEAMNFAVEAMEAVLAIFVLIAAVAGVVGIFPELFENIQGGIDAAGLTELLEQVLAIAIALEFLKMLLKPNVQTVVEVIIFLIARHMIIIETTPQEDLMSVISIVLLLIVQFAISWIKKNFGEKKPVENVNPPEGAQNTPTDFKEVEGTVKSEPEKVAETQTESK